MSRSRLSHLDRYPQAPTAAEQAGYNLLCTQEYAAPGVQYQTGPRFGQQLAAAGGRP